MREILRTEDGNFYEGDADIGDKSFGRHGRPIRVEVEMRRAIEGVVRAARHGLSFSGVHNGSIEFGLKLDPEAGFVISRGTADANVILRLELGEPEPGPEIP
ncbi:MAG TPA: CU044_2847 family protein [Candidatus Limnocylindrales bacterium]|nr:CU044_2847 family protein [Candidatus Limnocylindrales bacterium]